jgi:rubrerythrin
MDDVTAASCVKFAMSIEEVGAEMYESLAQTFASDRELRELFAGLARDELQHRALFRALRDRALSQPSERKVAVEVANYVRAMSMSNVLTGLKGLHGHMETLRSRDDALQRALSFEKATLGFFQAMSEVFEGDEVFASLVAVEKSHVVKVMELMLTGEKFRGLADRF